MRRQPSFSRESFGVHNKAPWLKMLGHALHEFHENDLFTSAAAMSYFGLLTLFPGLILLLTFGKRLTTGPCVFLPASVLWTFILLALFYRYMPNARVSLRDTIPGAIIAGLLWEAGKYIFAWSLHYFHYDQLYGSVGAVVAVMTWGYVSSLILLYGAQLTAVFHHEHPPPHVNPSAADAAIAPMP